MKITDIRIRKLYVDSKIKAIFSVTFDSAFVVHDVKVVEGPNGLIVAMPSRKRPDGKYCDIFHPISADAREVVSSAIMSAYNEAVDQSSQDGVTA
ncbi:septation regulator SpoVG [Heliobacterium gestii]|uniref:Putative septation protein SpoVG n=1 Tax=Heliomicrobium gestii TaxID=2699 RepID=A0A845LJW3_HELGE|nr:septation regulator SpoVG [Heliomicrobium gestii]MBM7867429.1 stage V sporulation protein G [Heliomicrobium gestii]MZP43693.1 septation regulator SpoVG [Heliomicrobium gestii]